MIVINLSFSVLILNFSGLKSSKLTNFAGVAHNVLSIFNSLTYSFYIGKNNALRRKFYTLREQGFCIPCIIFYI